MNKMAERIRLVKAPTDELLARIKEADEDLKNFQHILHQRQLNCEHNWSDPVYDPIVREGYEHPGDPPGTMGVDWRGPTWVPREEKPRWKRVCSKCKLEQETRSTRNDVKKVPVF